MISFFYRHSFLGTQHRTNEVHILRLGSEIRGKQIADYLGAKHNPVSGFEKDVCIHVKPVNLSRVRDGDWVDIADGGRLWIALNDRPKINVITHSEYIYGYLKDKLVNKMVCIPQQHLNWENDLRDRDNVTTAGYIGSASNIAFKIYDEIKDRLAEIGLQFITCWDYKDRQDAVNFYKKIDLLVVGCWKDNNLYKTATKMINAASFGIPSIAMRLLGYKEFEGNYVPINNVDEIVEEAKKFKDADYYKGWADKGLKASEKYHICEIAKKYEELI